MSTTGFRGSEARIRWPAECRVDPTEPRTRRRREKRGSIPVLLLGMCLSIQPKEVCVCVCVFFLIGRLDYGYLVGQERAYFLPPRLKSVVLLETGSPKEGFGKRTALAASNSWDRLNPPDRGFCVSLLSSVQIDENPVSQTGSQPI